MQPVQERRKALAAGVDRDVCNFSVERIAYFVQFSEPCARIRGLQKRTILVMPRSVEQVLHGGGAVLAQANRERLRTRGTVVYLRAAVKDLLNRTRHDKNRPLLQTGDPRARLSELYEMRDPLYREVAHVTIDTGSQSLATLMNRLYQVLETGCDRTATMGQPQCEP